MHFWGLVGSKMSILLLAEIEKKLKYYYLIEQPLLCHPQIRFNILVSCLTISLLTFTNYNFFFILFPIQNYTQLFTCQVLKLSICRIWASSSNVRDDFALTRFGGSVSSKYNIWFGRLSSLAKDHKHLFPYQIWLRQIQWGQWRSL